MNRKIAALIAPLLVLATALASPGKVSGSSPPLLVKVVQIRSLSRSEANRGYPVRLRAVVTYYGGASPDLFVHDNTGGIWVRLPKGAPPLKSGELVDVEGIAEQPDFAPQIGHPTIRVVGQTALPAAPEVLFSDMASAGEDGQWVAIKGVVRNAEIDRKANLLILGIAMEGGMIKAQVPGFYAGIPAGLVDSEVAIHGNCGAVWNARDQLIGIRIHVPGLSYIRLIGPAATDPWALPVHAIADLQRFAFHERSGHRIHVRGVVAQPFSGSDVNISDGEANLWVHTSEPVAAKAGDRVDVVGFPGIVDRHPNLEDSVVQITGRGVAPSPTKITPAMALLGPHDSSLVTIEGRLAQSAVTPAATTLTFRQGASVFTAESKVRLSKPELEALQEGSLLRIAGICVVDTDRDGNPISFKILFGDPGGIVVLEKPSWWTLRRALEIGGLLALAILGTLTWAAMLRRRVQGQTEIIRATLDSTGDGILVVDTRQEKIVNANRQFAEMWSVPTAILETCDDNKLLAYVIDQLKDPEGFLATVRELNAKAEGKSDDVLEFKDGRVFERHSEPQRMMVAGRLETRPGGPPWGVYERLMVV